MNLLVIVLASQLLYYLLIAQTGVVGVFDSQIQDFYTLPIGGIVGSLLSGYWRHNNIRTELSVLFGIQVLFSWFYPSYSLGALLVLGFVIGYSTPLLLYLFGSQSKLQLALGLAISYAVGTALYTYPFAQRGGIAIVLPVISVISLYFADMPSAQHPQERGIDRRIVAMMMLWIFADSALFETLTRTETMDIWSDHTWLIISSHLAGVFFAYRTKGLLSDKTRVIWGLFMVSYLLFWLREPIILAIVYPIVISYYNVLLFQALIRIGNIRTIALSMVGVGWIAASAANAVALHHQLWVGAAALGVFGVLYPFYFRRVS